MCDRWTTLIAARKEIVLDDRAGAVHRLHLLLRELVDVFVNDG